MRVRLPRNPPTLETGPAIAVLVACKGESEHSRKFFQHLMAQRYRPFRVILAVESATDSALNLLRLPGVTERTEAVIAGQAHDSSQKVANVIAGLARLRPEDEILVLADADHVPPPDWLGRVAAPIVAGTVDVVTGYRLSVPRVPTLGSCLTAAMDNAICTAPRPDFHVLCWGGCTAAWRHNWEKAGFREGLEGSFNDDVMVSQLFRKAGFRFAMPRHMTLLTEITYSLKGLLNYAPRQYMQVRWYAPWNRWWCRLLLPIPVLGWTAAIAAAALGYGWGWATVAAGFAAAIAKAFLRRSLVRQIAGAEALPRWRCVFWLTCLAPPLLALVHCLLAAKGLFGRTVVWAGTRYRIDAPKRVVVLDRRPDLAA
ncbi:MAG TPA: glycosyltransferase family 2 protein [Kiloniellales bacterium]|nr:glycosyltransferase family 2 protein [Kiloniellales bacterium]